MRAPSFGISTQGACSWRAMSSRSGGIVAALAVCRPRCSARIQKSHLPLLPPRVSAPLEFCCHHRASSERAAAACICKHAAQSERRHRSCDPWAAARSKRSRWTIRPSSDRATVPWAWAGASPRAVYFVCVCRLSGTRVCTRRFYVCTLRRDFPTRYAKKPCLRSTVPCSD